LISGAGALHIPRLTRHRRMDEFRGAAFHSRSGHSVDLTGKRVAVIGTGPVHSDVPELVRRDAGWPRCSCISARRRVVPRPNSLLPDTVRKAFAYVPGLRLAVRSGIYWGLEGLGYAMTQRPGLYVPSSWS